MRAASVEVVFRGEDKSLKDAWNGDDCCIAGLAEKGRLCHGGGYELRIARLCTLLNDDVDYAIRFQK